MATPGDTVIPEQALQKGSVVESFEILKVIGFGGFGITYKAQDRSLQRLVAIKEYFPSGLALRFSDGMTLTAISENDSEGYEYGLRRFLDEARTLAQFHDPSIVHVIRFIEANKTAYLVMDYEDGEPLSRHLASTGPLRENKILSIICPLLRGLRVVHAKNFLHRDIKPSNIFLRDSGPPLLLDFGSARQALEQQSKAMTVMLTPGYAPIEQYSSAEQQGAWSDLYAIGATMYHCAIGTAPPVATERLAAVYNGSADPASEALYAARDRYSATLIETIEWLLQPSAADRPKTADQALDALAEAATTAPRETTPAPAPGSRAGSGGPTASAGPRTERLERTGGVSVQWPTAVLEDLKRFLRPHIGRASQHAVTDGARKASSLPELIEYLAGFIESETGQSEFLTRARSATTKTARATPDSEAPTRVAPGHVPELEITPDVAEHAQTLLAEYLGPIAKVLVKRSKRKATSLDHFKRLLAEEIADHDMRREFEKRLH